MEKYLGKKYKQVSSENLDEYLKELGVNLIIRKFITMARATTSLTEEDGTYTLSVASMGVVHKIVFKIGEEIEEDTLDGRKCKTIFKIKDNVLTQHQLGEKECFICYTFTENELKIEMRYKDIISTRISNLVEKK